MGALKSMAYAIMAETDALWSVLKNKTPLSYLSWRFNLRVESAPQRHECVRSAVAEALH
jgi:hypothetical protein